MISGKKIIIAGGGTGGHLFSGLAVAEVWTKDGGDVVFVGTERGIEKKLVPQYGYKIKFIDAKQLKGHGLGQKLKALFSLPRGLIQSFKILRSEKPSAVLGIGGYASGPLVMGAFFLGIPTAIIDQNSIPGFTNRILGKIAKLIFLNYENATKYFSKNVYVTGNPVLSARIPASHAYQPVNTLTILGGSQGARAVNEKVMAVLPSLAKKYPDLKVIHQTGPADFESVKKEYAAMTLNVTVAPFFDNLDEVLSQTGLLLARSGAGTMTEVALWGLPSVLIPFPFAADDHQRLNAQEFVDHHAAILLNQNEATPETLQNILDDLLGNKEKRMIMAKKAFDLAKPRAARDVADKMSKMVA
ncbi:undecaprenyldiphospho-muramoylpentapeptide beta-N-acetylglucosaminyltransferase [bacterium]|nr:undecaprenyldiphospho-muramoylpentapeptide beta-N-acetylglucosaminyltransferase [bacterium]